MEKSGEQHTKKQEGEENKEKLEGLPVEKSGEQHTKKQEGEENKETLEGLPVETSPYTQYKNVEDYNRQGYGAEGHQEPKAGLGGGSTDAPTLSGTAAPEAQHSPTDVAKRHGAP